MRFCPVVTNLYREYCNGQRMTAAANRHLACFQTLNTMVSFAEQYAALDDELKVSFAEEAWRYSWAAVRNGDDRTAQELIDLARRLSRGTRAPMWLRLLPNVVSPILFEKAVLRIGYPLAFPFSGNRRMQCGPGQ
jgi:hypothetical protein